MASEDLMMNFQVSHASAGLATPAVALENLQAQLSGTESACDLLATWFDPCQELELLFFIKQYERVRQCVHQYFRIAACRVRAGQEIGADHLQTVAARSIRAEHEGRGLDRLLHNGKLALKEFEIDEI